MSPRTVPRLARYTYRRHAQAALLEGVLAGVLVTNDVVARKAFDASQLQLVLLTMAPASFQLLAVVLSHRFEATERRRLFFWAGVLGRLVLFLVAAVAGPWSFLGVLTVHGLVQTVLVPAQNAVFQANYDPAYRGRLFSLASTYGGLATAACALGAGVAMDRHPEVYRWLYPAAGLAGFGACLVFGSIRLRRGAAREMVPVTAPEGASLPVVPPAERASTLSVLRQTLWHDVGFRRYETALFVYGMGFMTMQPVFARLFVDELHTGYATASLGKGFVFYAAYVACLGVAGRLHDRIGMERVATLSFLTLAAFAAVIASVRTPAQAVAAFSLYGIGMAGVNVIWTMGPLRYAPRGSAVRYMGVHVALVGVRALLGHPLGGYLAERLGSSRPAFACAGFFFLAASALMWRAWRAPDSRRYRVPR